MWRCLRSRCRLVQFTNASQHQSEAGAMESNVPVSRGGNDERLQQRQQRCSSFPLESSPVVTGRRMERKAGWRRMHRARSMDRKKSCWGWTTHTHTHTAFVETTFNNRLHWTDLRSEDVRFSLEEPRPWEQILQILSSCCCLHYTEVLKQHYRVHWDTVDCCLSQSFLKGFWFIDRHVRPVIFCFTVDGRVLALCPLNE